ncbi:MAG: Flp family type IVb pilin [Bryobacterales bacterium]|nr:Flp family type IVb pilin [Acidobacteriota bacterium]MCB9385210.1 Flp family type IVb pilin [Bryobacterales bacterium]
MKSIFKQIVQLRIWIDNKGQDMVEYALMAGFITIAVGAAYPPISDDVSIIFSKIQSLVEEAP